MPAPTSTTRAREPETEPSRSDAARESREEAATPRYLEARGDWSRTVDTVSPAAAPSPADARPEEPAGGSPSTSPTATADAGEAASTESSGETAEAASEEGEQAVTGEEDETEEEAGSEGTEGEEAEGEEGEDAGAEEEEEQGEEEQEEEEQQEEQEEGETGEGEAAGGDGETHVGPDTAGGSGRKGKPFLQPTPIPRLGITTPLVHAPPKPSMERREEVANKTGMPPELHHAQVQDALNHTTQGARDAQRQMVISVERIAGDTRLSAEEMADEIPGVVAACVAQIDRVVDETIQQVEDAGEQYRAHIEQHGVLVGEELENNRRETTLAIYNELQAGADHIEEADRIIRQHFDANLTIASDKINELPSSGTFEPIPNPHPSEGGESESGDAEGEASGESSSEGSGEGGGEGGSTSKTVAEAQTALEEWMPEGARQYASEFGASTGHYYSERTLPAIPSFLEPTGTQITDGQTDRAEQLDSEPTRAEFAILSLGLTAPVATRHREDPNETEDTADTEGEINEEEALTGSERAQKTIEDKVTGVVKRLRDTTKPDFIKNVRKAGRQAREGLLEQGEAARSALIGAAAGMADAYRDVIERLKLLLQPDRFLDARALIPKIKAALISAQHLRDTHVKASEEQAFGTLAQLEQGKRDQVEALWKMTNQSTDSLADVITQSRFDFMLFAEQMTGVMTEGGTDVIGEATIFADKMAENILRIAGRNDNESVPHLESLAASFLNGQITAAQNWQYQVVRGHEGQLKRGNGGLAQVWASILTDLNRRASAIDQALPDSGTSAGGALASAVVGGAVAGPVGALAGLGAYLWAKDPDEDAVIAALADLPIPGGPALEEVFVHSGFGALDPRIRDTMDDPEKTDALDFLSTDASRHARAVESVVEQSDDWFGYNRAAREAALRGISPEVREHLSEEQIEGMRTILEEDLDGSEETISTAYLDGRRDLALAARMQEERQRAEREGNRGLDSVHEAERQGDQARVDMVARIDELTRAELAFEYAYIPPQRLESFRNEAFQAYAMLETPEAERPVGGFSTEEAQQFVIQELTAPRTALIGHGEYMRVETVAMSPEAERYIRDAITHGGESDEARESRSVYEIERARDEGGELSETTQLRLTQTLENPRLSDLRARLEHAGTPEERALLEQQVAEAEAEHQARMTSLAERLGAPESVLADPAAATKWLGGEVGELFAREGSEHARYGQELIERGRPTMVAGIALATNKAGTHEDLLMHTYEGRTQEEIDAVQQQWADENNGEDLNVMLGIAEREWDAADYATLALMPALGPLPFLALQGFRGGETSGDVAMRLQRLAQGPQTTDLAAVNMAGLRVDQQERGTGFIADVTMSGASETEVMNERRRRLGELIVNAAEARGEDVSRFREDPGLIFGTNGQLNSDLQDMAFSEDGEFHGNTLELHGLTHATGLAADNYQAEIDRQESILTTAISVLTIAVSIALLFVPGVNLVAAGILTAVVGGALTMTAKYGMRGERYGWEEAATDLAQTGIEAATAGIGGAMAGGLGKTGALFRAGEAINSAFGKVGGAMVREAITGALSNAAQVAIQDDTFKDGMDTGFERLFSGALKGAAIGAISAGVSEKLGDSMDDAMSRGLRQADDLADITTMQRVGQMLGPNGRAMFREGISEAVGSSLGESVGVLIDYANGDFRGSFADALKRIGQAGLRDMVSGIGRSAAGARNRQRYNDLLTAARAQGGEITPQQARALRLAGISAGVMNYDTPMRDVHQEVNLGRQARQHLPPEMQHLADTLDARTLMSLVRGIESGDFGTPEQKLAFIKNIASQMPGLDQRDFAERLNKATADAADVRARAQAEQAALAVKQKQARNALLADVPGPARKALAKLNIEGLDALPPAAMREAADMIGRGQFDAARAEALLRQARQRQPDLDEATFMRNLLQATDTSRRAQAAVQEQRQQQRKSLASALPPENRAWVARLSDADAQRLQGVIRGDSDMSPAQRDALFRRAQKQHPELTRAQFDSAIEAGKNRHRATVEAAKAEQRQARMARMESIPEHLRPLLADLPEHALVQLRMARQEGRLSDTLRKQLIDTALAENPGLDAARLKQALDTAVRQDIGPKLSRAELAAMRKELLASVPADQRHLLAGTPILRVSDAEFAAMTRSQTGEAVTMIIDGRAVVVIRESADPKVLREEGLHVLQSRDPQWREKVGSLDERTLAEWDKLPLSEQLALYGNKIAIEIDAQQRMIARLEADLERAGSQRKRLEITGDLELARAMLDNLVRRQAEVRAIDQTRIMEIQSGLISRPQWLDQPARLFNKPAKPKSEAGVAPVRDDKADREAITQRLTDGLDETKARELKEILDAMDIGHLRVIDQHGGSVDAVRDLVRKISRTGDAPAYAKRLAEVLPSLNSKQLADIVSQLNGNNRIDYIKDYIDGLHAIRQNVETDEQFQLVVAAAFGTTKDTANKLDASTLKNIANAASRIGTADMRDFLAYVNEPNHIRKLLELAGEQDDPQLLVKQTVNVLRSTDASTLRDTVDWMAKRSTQEALEVIRGLDNLRQHLGSEETFTAMIKIVMTSTALKLDVIRDLTRFAQDLDPRGREALAVLLDRAGEADRAGILKELVDLHENTVKPIQDALDKENPGRLMSMLLQMAATDNQWRVFLGEAVDVLSTLRDLPDSPENQAAIKKILEYLYAPLTNEYKTSDARDIEIQHMATDISKAAKALREPTADGGTQLRTIEARENIIRRQVANLESDAKRLVEGDEWASSLANAAETFREMQNDPEAKAFADLLKSLTADGEILHGWDDGQLGKLKEVKAWFDHMARTMGLDPRSTDPAQVKQLRDLLRMAIELGLEGSRNRDIKQRSRFDDIARAFREMSTRAGIWFNAEAHTKMTRQMREDVLKRMGLSEAELKARSDSKALNEHIDTLIERQIFYERMLAIAESTGASDAGLKQNITEVRGEIALTVHILKTRPDLQLAMPFGKGTGFDQVWVKIENGEITEVVIGEAKGPGAKLGNPAKGPQMSRQWVAATLREMAASSDPATRDLARRLIAAANKLPPGGTPPAFRGIVVEAREKNPGPPPVYEPEDITEPDRGKDGYDFTGVDLPDPTTIK